MLWAAGQTINVMTLGGLALAVGVLVDEATVEIENIHTRMLPGVSRARAVVEACSRTAMARLLSMFCILAVFVPSFFMIGVSRQLFVPLSLAVAFSMIASYLLSSSLVPVFSTWLMREAHPRRRARGILRRSALALRTLPGRRAGASAGRSRSSIWPGRFGLLYFCCRAWERNFSRTPTRRSCASACARRPARASRRPNASCCTRSMSFSGDAGPGQHRDHQRLRRRGAFQLSGGPDSSVHQRAAGSHHPGGAEARRPARRSAARTAPRSVCAASCRTRQFPSKRPTLSRR